MSDNASICYRDEEENYRTERQAKINKIVGRRDITIRITDDNMPVVKKTEVKSVPLENIKLDMMQIWVTICNSQHLSLDSIEDKQELFACLLNKADITGV